MKQFKKLIFWFAIFISNKNISAQNCIVTTHFKDFEEEKICISPCGTRTFFLPRSQGDNVARWIVGWKKIMPECPKGNYGNISLTTEYAQSFKSDRIAQYLFGSTCLNFKGSQVHNRNPENDILADYFGLPTTFEGQICFKPTIQNIIIDFNYYLGLDTWFHCLHGLYWFITFPVVITFWDLGLNCSENNNRPLVDPFFPACYMSDKPAKTVPTIQTALRGQGLFGDMKSPFDFGLFPFSKRRKSGIADINFIWGWNFILTSCNHVGAFLQLVIPGGNRPNSSILFEPMVGNGKNWEFGGGFNGNINLYNSENSSFNIYFWADIIFRFKTLQIRSFDYQDRGFLSRYLLLKEFNDKEIYKSNLFNAIDVATKAARVGSLLHGDLAIKFSYFRKCWQFDLGYNLWGKSHERIKIVRGLFPSDLENRCFGIKGTEGVCFKVFDLSTQTLTDQIGVLNSTQNTATITNSGATNNKQAINLGPDKVAITWDRGTPRSPTAINNFGDLKIAFQSNPPSIVTVKDLDPCSAAVPSQLTHKFFAHLNYIFWDACWQPQIGIGGEVEFDGRSKSLAALNQWGIWLKTNVSF